ncbi:hypothetical protein LZ554_002461 [Drepanopeziza brunnea f. sp. 'monogermtubi']|nr:hypothetical protein LZ554_002461 [Drepanopeziza brunnea f. sp. 'monogermtubi']
MASQASAESPSRRVLVVGSPPRVQENGEYKENAGSPSRKEAPTIPIPDSGRRLQGAPTSSAKVNVQRENWPPRPSSATVENGGYGKDRQYSQDSAQQYEPESFQYRMPVTQDMPLRPGYNTSGEAPQVTVISSGASASLRTPSDGSLRREYNVDENANEVEIQPVPRLQYHHQSHHSDGGVGSKRGSPNRPTSELVGIGQSINRHLTPTAQTARRSSTQRPISAYSDMRRGSSPALSGSPMYGGRASSANSGRSSDGRPLSYIDLANMSYPQAAPAPISLDNSQLRSVVGSNASLLTMAKTLEMYRQNVKKLNDSATQYAFAIFLIQAAQEAGLNLEGDSPARKPRPKSANRDTDSPYVDKPLASPQELLNEAKHMLQKLSDRSYPFAQYYLADGYASGLFNKGKEDYGTAFPLFVSASKHGHAESGYRAALCYEFGWGCRKDAAKAVQFYRQSASKNHPGAMTRLGRACLFGNLGLNKYREGIKWLKRATESADSQYNAAPYHLGLLYETGHGDDIFQDEIYAAQLFTQAADLGHAESCYRLGNAYEHGKLGCPRDPALSVHFYTGAAQRGHPAGMMALCAWYMVGAEPILEKDENEAYEWARQAADAGLTKAQYAVGYFTEMGIGCRRDPLEANVWYVQAADSGDERAKLRLAAIRAAASGAKPMEVAPPRNGKVRKGAKGALNEKECVVM